ncbi:DUF4232 domain-containing protein [Streptomyces sp. NPDC051561]|uniref:DUF4232 domain-containing protein n=1 Tax=Streptomyces sp. NPDC051561 TaxID=3365658 RepID=UPI0037B0BEE1
MRTATRRPVVLAATAFAALTLTLTACSGDGTGTRSEGGGAPASAPKDAAGAASGDKATEGGKGEAGTSGSGTSGAGTAGSGDSGSGTSGSGAATSGTQTGAKSQQKAGGKARACTVNDLSITAAKQEGVPTTHITLTAKNTSGRSCTLVKYPLLAFGDIQTAKDVPAVPKSKPGTPVVLEAGAPAYAAVRINNGGRDEENRAVSSFNVNLFAADGPAEGSKVVRIAGGIAVDDAVAKTGYWTPELRNGADEF